MRNDDFTVIRFQSAFQVQIHFKHTAIMSQNQQNINKIYIPTWASNASKINLMQGQVLFIQPA